MEKEPIDYEATIGAGRYKDGLEVHPYIAQADAVMKNRTKRFSFERGNAASIQVLDLGCGPDRLTSWIADIAGVQVTGLDYSPGFIEAARNGNVPANVEFIQADFAAYEPSKKFDVIFMEGVWHHVPLEKRQPWLEKMNSALSPGGIVILGDEVIPEYASEEERRARVGLLYLHIIGEALKITDERLAEDECINFLSDTLDEHIAGFYDDALIAYLKQQAKDINERLFTFDESKRLTGEGAAKRMAGIIRAVTKRSHALSASKTAKRTVRGDYKVSIPVLEKEFAQSGFALSEAVEVGPVDYIGGMGVLVFEKA